MISSKKYVDETLRANNLVANKALGQNFLVESEIASYIVDSANITKETCVIEIGPGLGALTEFAVKKAGLLMAFEIDKNMVNILTKTFENEDNILINNIDFLKVDIEKTIEEIHQKGYDDIVVLSNLPYYITSKLLNKILVNDIKIRSIVTMMQKEVGQKILKPEKKDYNLLSIILDYQFDVSVVKYVGKNSYLPRPEIDSIVLKFERISPRYDVDFNTLVNVSNALLIARRKTVSNNLKNVFKSQEKLNECLESLGILPNTRIEQLSTKNIIDICNFINIQ